MVSRRRMLAVTAGTALGTVVPVAAATVAEAKPRGRSRTLSAQRAVRNGRLSVPQTAFRLSHLAVAWRGPVAQVRLRTARGWTRWQTLDGCPGGRDGRDQRHGRGHEGGSAVLVAPAAVGYEVWVAGEGVAEVTELSTVDASVSTLATATATATVASAMPLPGGVTCPVPYLSRAAWGADESFRFTNGVEDFPPEYYPVQTLTVHHSATANGDADPAATVRAIYYNQTVNKGWGDIGYQLLIDEAGRVYEGRWSGSDSVPVFSGQAGADGRPQMVTGAHVENFNSGNLGICLLGDFTSQLPTTAARESLKRILASLSRVCLLDPLGTTNYVNPVSGATKAIKTIPGHRDWAATQCPGNTFYPELPTLREDAARWRPLVPSRSSTSGSTLPPRRTSW